MGCWETLPRMLCKLMLLLSGTRPAGNFNSLISLCSSSFLSIHLIVMLFSWHHNYYRICFCLDLSWHVSHWLYVSGMSWQTAVKWSIWSCHIAFTSIIIRSRVAAMSEHAWARWGHVLFISSWSWPWTPKGPSVHAHLTSWSELQSHSGSQQSEYFQVHLFDWLHCKDLLMDRISMNITNRHMIFAGPFV